MNPRSESSTDSYVRRFFFWLWGMALTVLVVGVAYSPRLVLGRGRRRALGMAIMVLVEIWALVRRR